MWIYFYHVYNLPTPHKNKLCKCLMDEVLYIASLILGHICLVNLLVYHIYKTTMNLKLRSGYLKWN